MPVANRGHRGEGRGGKARAFGPLSPPANRTRTCREKITTVLSASACAKRSAARAWAAPFALRSHSLAGGVGGAAGCHGSGGKAPASPRSSSCSRSDPRAAISTDPRAK